MGVNGMGFFDKLLREGGKALGNTVADSLETSNSSVGKAFRMLRDAADDYYGDGDEHEDRSQGMTMRTRSSRSSSVEEEWDDRMFDEKLPDVIAKLGNGEYEIIKGVAPEELERRCGEEIYSKENTCCKPNKITYEIARFGATLLYIRLWDDYTQYNHETNRQIKRYCDSHGIKMLDFFEYLPNEVDYMENRIGEQLR